MRLSTIRHGRDGPADGPAENDGKVDVRKEWEKNANGRRYGLSTVLQTR
jgi:hypothetical protein